MKDVIYALLLTVITTPVAISQDWHTNFEEVKAIAKQTDKTIVLVFQGSDWCAPCIKLDREIWSSGTFQEYAQEHYVMLKADFPRKKRHALSKEQSKSNAELAELYNKSGYFPFVVILDEEGEVLGETSYYKTTPENYITKINSFLK